LIIVRGTVVLRYTNSQACSVKAQGHGTTKIVATGVDSTGTKVINACITLADRGLQLSREKSGVTECEQPYSAGTTRNVGCAVIVGCTNCQVFAIATQGNRQTKIVVSTQHDIDIFSAAITFADGANQGTTTKIAVGKVHQMNRTVIATEPRVFQVAVVIGRTDDHLLCIAAE